jgi:hypothetical protein
LAGGLGLSLNGAEHDGRADLTRRQLEPPAPRLRHVDDRRIGRRPVLTVVPDRAEPLRERPAPPSSRRPWTTSSPPARASPAAQEGLENPSSNPAAPCRGGRCARAPSVAPATSVASIRGARAAGSDRGKARERFGRHLSMPPYRLPMPDRRADYSSFGIGSFHLSPGPDLPQAFTGEEFAQAIRRGLESIGNIAEIRMSLPDEFLEASFTHDPKSPSFLQSIPPFPDMSVGRVGFDLYIPDRLQSELWRTYMPGPLRKTLTEQFSVSIHYISLIPVVYITTVDPTDSHNDPSDAVPIVFALLATNLARSGLLRFNPLEPSPFPLDCYVRPETDPKASDPPFATTRTSARGFDEMVFSYNSQALKTVEAAEERIFDTINQELNFYYFLKYLQELRASRWLVVDSLVQGLRALESSTGLKGYRDRLFASSGQRNRAFMALADFESLEIQAQAMMATAQGLTYRPGRSDLFKDDADAALRAQIAFPSEQANRLLQLFEARRSAGLQNLVVSTSGIVGVAVGAWLGHLLG